MIKSQHPTAIDDAISLLTNLIADRDKAKFGVDHGSLSGGLQNLTHKDIT